MPVGGRETRASARASMAAFSALALIAAEAEAADVEIQAQTAAQAYEVGSPWDERGLERRRIMQTLGFSAYHLQGEYEPGKADYQARLLLRLDSDFGLSSHLGSDAAGGETDFGVAGGAFYAAGLEPARVDFMYAYVEGRDLADGWLGFKVGRQPVTDVLGWWSFDGGLMRVTTPFFAQLEAYGGFEQRGGLPLSSSRYEMQGMWRGSHADFDDAGSPTARDLPSFHEASPAPAFGFALETNGPPWVHGRLSYRRVYNTGDTITRQLQDPNGGYPTASGMRLSSERIGYAANAGLPFLGGIKGGFAYDLYGAVVSQAFGGAEVYATDWLTVGADVDHFEPIFDADSIWNWFSKQPSTSLTGRVELEVTQEISFSGSGGTRLWRTEGDPDTFGQGECDAAARGSGAAPCNLGDPAGFDPVSNGEAADFRRNEENRSIGLLADGLGSLAGRYRDGGGFFELRSMLQAGERGRRVGGELSGEKGLDGGRFTVGSRVSVYDWADPTREGRDATSFGYVLAGGFQPLQEARMRVEWEHSLNDLVGNRFRLVGLLDILVLR